MGAALKFRHADVPRQASETARLKVVRGPDLGVTFVVNAARATIGRGEDCDIVITDLKASRKHAELVLAGNQWSIRDLGSANGLSHNGKSTRNANLRTADKLTFGETTMEFVSSEAGTTLLRAIPKPLDEPQRESTAFLAQKQKVRQLAQLGAAPRPAAQAMGAPSGSSSRAPLLLAAAGIVAFVLFGTGDKPPVLRQKAQPADLVQYLPQSSAPLTEAAKAFLNEGFREYREGNYLRARTQFETVLQVAPGNSLATLYLNNCKKAINDEVTFELQHGQRDYEDGNLTQAKIHFESVCRLLYRDQSNPAFAEAKDHATQVYHDLNLHLSVNDPENSCGVGS